jgi:hypothetical protein
MINFENVTNITTEHNVGGVMEKMIGKLNGKKVMIKKANYDINVFNEVFAYKFLSKLGFKVNKVEITETNEWHASIHYWNNNFETISKLSHVEEDKFKNEKYESMKVAMKLFDCILGNDDRHQGNYGIDKKTGFLYLIDHGYMELDDYSYLNSGYHFKKIVKENMKELTNNTPARRIIKRFLKLSIEDLKEMIYSIDLSINKEEILNIMINKQKIVKDILRNIL